MPSSERVAPGAASEPAASRPVSISDNDDDAGDDRPSRSQSATPSARPTRMRRPPQGVSADADAADEEVEGYDLDYVSDDDAAPVARRGGRGGVPGDDASAFRDYTSTLAAKPDPDPRPLWVLPSGRILLEAWSPAYVQASDFLVAVAEPVQRPELLHEYRLTAHSLYAAVSAGVSAEEILYKLDVMSKVGLAPEVAAFVRAATANYGKVKLVLRRGGYWVETADAAAAAALAADPVIAEARVGGQGAVVVGEAPADAAGPALLAGVDAGMAHAAAAAAADAAAEAGGGGGDGGRDGMDADGGGRGQEAGDPAALAAAAAAGSAGAFAPPAPGTITTHSFEVAGAAVERVKARCLPDGLNCPLLEEYDFVGDGNLAPLQAELKPGTVFRPYQVKAMEKMFGNGRARSGVVVLPCGAGKTLVGVTAAMRVRRPTLVLVTNNVAVDQWRHQFKLWSTIQDHQIARFTSDYKEEGAATADVVVSTYTMVSFGGARHPDTQALIDAVAAREWGLLVMDEVHVVPAAMFRRVIGLVKAHAKLGLTATLVREDELITDLNFLIGPKLYEANWQDLARAGHIANVSCAEVLCPLAPEFAAAYLNGANAGRRTLLATLNPTKFAACRALIAYHEAQGDKTIVFSDNLYTLREYAVRLRKPFVSGATPHAERTRVLALFKTRASLPTIFLSKVGDNSIDIPEANVLIQISAHAGSRRQEAQRLGRILRAKRAPGGAPPPPGEFNAFFYTLVSSDTQEEYWSAKRRQFLVDQGYAFRAVTDVAALEAAVSPLPPRGPLETLSQAERDEVALWTQLSTAEERQNLVSKIISTDESAAGEEVLNNRPPGGRGAPGATRTSGSLASLSGARGLTYLEYGAEDGGKPKSKKPRLTTASGKARHLLFRKRAEGRL